MNRPLKLMGALTTLIVFISLPVRADESIDIVRVANCLWIDHLIEKLDGRDWPCIDRSRRRWRFVRPALGIAVAGASRRGSSCDSTRFSLAVRRAVVTATGRQLRCSFLVGRGPRGNAAWGRWRQAKMSR